MGRILPATRVASRVATVVAAFLLCVASAQAAGPPTAQTSGANGYSGDASSNPCSSRQEAVGLYGFVDTNGLATTYYFEYGTSTAYGSSTPQQSIPAPGPSTPTGRPVDGVACMPMEGTTYHYRLVATNSAGTSSSPDATFTTPRATPPPEPKGPNRFYPDSRAPIKPGIYKSKSGGRFVLSAQERRGLRKGGRTYHFQEFLFLGWESNCGMTAFEFVFVSPPNLPNGARAGLVDGTSPARGNGYNKGGFKFHGRFNTKTSPDSIKLTATCSGHTSTRLFKWHSR